jgi:hypothetical protein
VPDIEGCKVVYDDIWYPSESIFYPALSAICVGFGTGAYTDLVSAGITFVDCALPGYSQEYPKPISDHYFGCRSGGEADAIHSAVLRPSIFKKTSHEERDAFTLQVMEGMNVQRT